MRVTQRTSLMGAILVIVLLSAGFAYYFMSTNNELALLKRSGNTVCQENSLLGSALQSMVENATKTLQGQIAVDQAIIIVLNTTRPDGYQTIVSSLQVAIIQDLRSLNNIYSLLPPGIQPVTPNPCTPFT